MSATGLAGAVFDSAASQDTGALCTGIGIGINSVMGPPDQVDFAPGVGAFATRIGSGTQAMNAIGFVGKNLTFRINSGGAAVANGAAMPGGAGTDLNRSGQSCPVNGSLWAVAP